MITLYIGENSFEIEREQQRIIAQFDGVPEKFDGSELELRQLPDLLMGSSLFAQKRLVIIKHLSDNKTVWANLSQWLERLSSDISLVLIESKPDKRTKTFKDLQKQAEVKYFSAWTDRDRAMAETWAVSEAKRFGFELSQQLARTLVGRTGIDQWRIFHALEKLSVLDEIDANIMRDVIELNPNENVFQLFETALRGDSLKVQTILQSLQLTEDPFRVFGLLSGQAFQLAALSLSEKPSADIAKDIAAHPFVLQKLSPLAKQIGRTGVRKVVDAFSQADAAMKTSTGDPWVLIERALYKIATI